MYFDGGSGYDKRCGVMVWTYSVNYLATSVHEARSDQGKIAPHVPVGEDVKGLLSYLSLHTPEALHISDWIASDLRIKVSRRMSSHEG